MQYEKLLFTSQRRGVQLWVPEIDEPADADNPKHQAIMKSVFWRSPHRLMKNELAILRVKGNGIG
jgi:hypothetical protein